MVIFKPTGTLHKLWNIYIYICIYILFYFNNPNTLNEKITFVTQTHTPYNALLVMPIFVCFLKGVKMKT
jgi:hypothetical protein